MFALKPWDDETGTVSLEHGVGSIERMGLPGRGILVTFTDGIGELGVTTVLSPSTWFGEHNTSCSCSISEDDRSLLEDW